MFDVSHRTRGRKEGPPGGGVDSQQSTVGSLSAENQGPRRNRPFGGLKRPNQLPMGGNLKGAFEGAHDVTMGPFRGLANKIY